MIEAGNRVRVTDWGRAYSSYTKWFETHEHEIEFEWAVRYAYGNTDNFDKRRYSDDTAYNVLIIIDGRALITDDDLCQQQVYLVDVDVIELYDRTVEMTISEIEEKLGIRNLKIVKEKEDKQDES